MIISNQSAFRLVSGHVSSFWLAGPFSIWQLKIATALMPEDCVCLDYDPLQAHHSLNVFIHRARKPELPCLGEDIASTLCCKKVDTAIHRSLYFFSAVASFLIPLELLHSNSLHNVPCCWTKSYTKNFKLFPFTFKTCITAWQFWTQSKFSLPSMPKVPSSVAIILPPLLLGFMSRRLILATKPST